MSAAGVVFWLADNVELWRPWALAGLTVFVLAVIWWFVVAWEKTQ